MSRYAREGLSGPVVLGTYESLSGGRGTVRIAAMALELRPRSPNLEYRRPVAADADALRAIIVDDHVRRYLCDGQTLPRTWTDEPSRASVRVLEKLGFLRCGELQGALGALLLLRLDAAVAP